MTEHSITPSPELVQQWLSEHFGYELSLHESSALITYSEITTKAARWGSDQELEACCEVLARELICDGKHVATDLRAVRRPKPPSLKQQALKTVSEMAACMKAGFVPKRSDLDTIRSALEQLPDQTIPLLFP